MVNILIFFIVCLCFVIVLSNLVHDLDAINHIPSLRTTSGILV